MMSLHKLSAGSGYTYLTRQVAAGDVTARGRGSLGAYYEQRGESPRVWLGGDPVSEEQMLALFGRGHHPGAVTGTAGGETGDGPGSPRPGRRRSVAGSR